MMLLILGINNSKGFGQKANNYKLKIGEEIPNLSLITLYNYKGKEKSLGDFRGKFLILDFWATWCGPCIASFPKMEVLRQKFKGKLEILPVTDDTEKKVKELFNNIKKDSGLDMFSVIEDNQIRSLFNFNRIPHYVWIDQRGKYMGDATQEDMNEEKIALAILGKGEILSNEPIVVRSVDKLAPLMTISIPMIENGQPKSQNIDSKIIRSSTFSSYIEGLGAALQIKKDRFTARNNAPGTMLTYLAAFDLNEEGLYSKQFYFFNTNRTIWEVNNKALLDYGPRGSQMIAENALGWVKHRNDHSFCYELKLGKDTSYKYVASQALAELNRRFKELLNISAHVEKRKTKCLVLKRTSGIDKVTNNSTQQGSVAQTNKTDRFSLSVIDKPYLFFIMPLVTQHLGYLSMPIIDETGFDLRKTVNIQLLGKLNDWKELNLLLAKYDLTFEEADRVIDMVIITDKPIGDER